MALQKKPYVKEFYFYEIIHHLTKSTDLFEEIYGHIDLYVSSKETSLDKGTQRKTTENELPSLTQCTA